MMISNTMSADEVLIRAREATIEAWKGEGDFAKKTRSGVHDRLNPIKAIIVYERDRAKTLAEVAPHTAEDPDEKVAYDLYVAQCGRNPYSWHERYTSPRYCGIIAGIKRGRELERSANQGARRMSEGA